MRIVQYPEESKAIPVYRDYMLEAGGHVYTIEEDARVLMWLAGKAGGDFLEIGCNEGMLTRAFAEWFPHHLIYAVDDPTAALNKEQEYERVTEVAKFARHLPNVVPVKINSRELVYPPCINFVLIDGDHTYEGVKADTWKAILYQPKIIAWHDYRPEVEWMGVSKLLDELVNDGVDLVRVEGTPIVVKGWPCG